MKHRVTAIPTPMNAPIGPATSAYMSNQSIRAVNGFVIFGSFRRCWYNYNRKIGKMKLPDLKGVSNVWDLSARGGFGRDTPTYETRRRLDE